MAAPTSPTLETICTEGLKKAGYSTSASNWSTLLSRAENYWMEEIKNDIYGMAKRLNDLITHAYAVTVNGQSVYSMPTDFGIELTMSLMDGSHYGIAQSGSNNTVTLASDEDIGETGIIGKEILIYSGTGSPDARQVIAYNESTKVATVHANWSTDPASGSCYLIIDSYPPLTQTPIWDYDAEKYSTIYSTPTHYVPLDDEYYGKFYLYPTPYRSTEVPWGIKMRYFGNLTTADLDGDLLSKLYLKWRNIFVHGVFARALQDLDDDRAEKEIARYYSNIRLMVSREQIGNELTNLRCKVSDYNG